MRQVLDLNIDNLLISKNKQADARTYHAMLLSYRLQKDLLQSRRMRLYILERRIGCFAYWWWYLQGSSAKVCGEDLLPKAFSAPCSNSWQVFPLLNLYNFRFIHISWSFLLSFHSSFPFFMFDLPERWSRVTSELIRDIPYFPSSF